MELTCDENVTHDYSNPLMTRCTRSLLNHGWIPNTLLAYFQYRIMLNRKPSTIILHAIIALIPLSLGIYTLVEEKIFLGGRFSAGKVYDLSPPGSILVAVSFFLFSAFVLLVLFEGKRIKLIAETTVVIAIILFIVGNFV